MEIQPIFASLRTHKIPVILIVLEIALACAVFCNAVSMISQRIAELNMPNAINQDGLVDISINGTDPSSVNDDISRFLASLRRVPGVLDAAATSSVPFGKGIGIDSVSTKPDSVDALGASRYMFTQSGPNTFGLHLLQGRFFNDDEYVANRAGDTSTPVSSVVIVTKSLGLRLWPEGDALGKQLWMGGGHYTVVGIVADVARPGSAGIGQSYAYYSTFFPVGSDPTLTDYVVRSAPQQRSWVLQTAIATLTKLAPNAVVKGQTFTDIRSDTFASMRSMMAILMSVCVMMLVVTAFSIVGLTSFWIGQRRRQVGVRRALGATRVNIMHYFQIENLLLSSAGVVLGMLIAFGANVYLMTHYQMDRMSWYYLPIGAIAMLSLGQVAVLGPALRSSWVPPVEAIRRA